MFIIDFKTEKIKQVDNFQMCNFINDLIAKGSGDLIGKRYLFVPNAGAAQYIIEKAVA
jgi:hypothetical protein